MKFLFLTSLFLTTTAFAQSLDVSALKSLFTENQAILEKINPGMSKRMTTKYEVETDDGSCEMTMTADRTVLLVQDTRVIIYSKESYRPSEDDSCANVKSQDVNVVFYEDRPLLASYIADLDATSSQIQSIEKTGNLITLKMETETTDDDGETQTQDVTVKYDLSQAGFKNTVLVESEESSVTTMDVPDVDVKKIDLTNVLFCESEDSDNCQQGNWSDIIQ